MVKNKLAALAIGLGLFACQNMQADNIVVDSVRSVWEVTKTSGDTLMNDHFWTTMGLASMMSVATLYKVNLTFRNRVRDLLGLDPVVRKKCCCSCSSCSNCCNKSMPTSERCSRVRP